MNPTPMTEEAEDGATTLERVASHIRPRANTVVPLEQALCREVLPAASMRLEPGSNGRVLDGPANASTDYHWLELAVNAAYRARCHREHPRPAGRTTCQRLGSEPAPRWPGTLATRKRDSMRAGALPR